MLWLRQCETDPDGAECHDSPPSNLLFAKATDAAGVCAVTPPPVLLYIEKGVYLQDTVPTSAGTGHQLNVQNQAAKEARRGWTVTPQQ